MRTLRISHPGISGAHTAATVHFYTEVLGMECVLQQPNLDYAPEDHYFFHVGNDNFIAYFLPRDEKRHGSTYDEARPGSGHMDHLAIDVDPAQFDDLVLRLRRAGVELDGPVDRGYERSVYFQDPNGVTVELLVWKTTPPAGLPLAAILKRAQHLREQRGAAIVEDADIQQAIVDLQDSPS